MWGRIVRSRIATILNAPSESESDSVRNGDLHNISGGDLNNIPGGDLKRIRRQYKLD